MRNLDLCRELWNFLSDGVYLVDREGRITHWNKAAETISGFSQGEVTGKRCSDDLLMHLNDEGLSLCSTWCPLRESILDGSPRTVRVYLRHREGFRLPVALRVAPLKNALGEITGGIAVFSDISAPIAAFQKIRELGESACLDPLTGVAGRKFLEAFLQSRLEEMQKYGWPLGILYHDLDHLKICNCLHGHEIGDRVLQMVARTLAKNTSSFDLVGRCGGQEFISVLAVADQAHLTDAAERYRSLIAHSKLILDDKAVYVTASIGGTLARPEDSLATIVERARQAMYQSKSSGRDCLTISC